MVLSMRMKSFRVELACQPEVLAFTTVPAHMPAHMPVRLHPR